MMREILFRGKRIDNGEWVYGSLFTSEVCWGKKIHYILPIQTFWLIDGDGTGLRGLDTFYKVDPKTVGQYIETVDKQRIFEGDKIEVWHHAYYKRTFVIDDIKALEDEIKKDEHGDTWKIIGNKWDNPELLEEVNNG